VGFDELRPNNDGCIQATSAVDDFVENIDIAGEFTNTATEIDKSEDNAIPMDHIDVCDTPTEHADDEFGDKELNS
jgi:hypothetical protein